MWRIASGWRALWLWAGFWASAASALHRNPPARDLNLNFWSFVEDRIQPNWDYLTHRYQPSPLERSDAQSILGIQTAKIYSRDEKGLLLRKAIAFALELNLAESDRIYWPTLAEKRYSYLRDLLNEIEAAKGADWTARDFKAPDGSFVFMGHVGELLIVRLSDGALIPEHRFRMENRWHEISSLPAIQQRGAVGAPAKDLACSNRLQS